MQGMAIANDMNIAKNARMSSPNPAVYAMQMLQISMVGEAKRAGIYNDEDVMAVIKEIYEEEKI